MDEATTAVAFKVCIHVQSRLVLYTEWEARDLRKQDTFVIKNWICVIKNSKLWEVEEWGNWSKEVSD